MITEIPKDLISPKAASKILHCHLATVYRLVHSGRLRSWWRGGTRHLVSEADVRALFEPLAVRPEVETATEARRRVEKAREELRARGIRA
jgi:excisionase family DNA binding protein